MTSFTARGVSKLRQLKDVVPASGSGGSSAADIWTYPDRTLTRFGNMTGVEFTYIVINSVNGLPISGVAVWFAVDGGGAQIVWSGHTDALGVARDAYGALPRLDPGTYYVFRARPGYVFQQPLSLFHFQIHDGSL